MPFIVSTSHVKENPTHDGTAYATIEEAREVVGNTLRDHDLYTQEDGDYTVLGNQCAGLSEQGDTIGPLPDGSVIDVQAVSWGGGS